MVSLEELKGFKLRKVNESEKNYMDIEKEIKYQLKREEEIELIYKNEDIFEMKLEMTLKIYYERIGKNKGKEKEEIREEINRIKKEMEKIKPDIIILQEVTMRHHEEVIKKSGPFEFFGGFAKGVGHIIGIKKNLKKHIIKIEHHMLPSAMERSMMAMQLAFPGKRKMLVVSAQTEKHLTKKAHQINLQRQIEKIKEKFKKDTLLIGQLHLKQPEFKKVMDIQHTQGYTIQLQIAIDANETQHGLEMTIR
mmetsp:Transcript_8517/g.12560  ORF Transcript_8517/g.12560 Transcript_8517/m.12560 type:complete len:250 (+) Transcript_8517:103-852(+)